MVGVIDISRIALEVSLRDHNPFADGFVLNGTDEGEIDPLERKNMRLT
jgi:hypothetical protein